MKTSKRKLYIFATIGLLLLGIGAVLYLSLPLKTSAYLIDCVKTNTDGSCATENALPKLSFRVYKLQDRVIEEHTGGIQEFNGCIIINIENWQCAGNGSSDFSMGFTDGEFFIKGGPASYRNLTVVPEKVWLKYLQNTPINNTPTGEVNTLSSGVTSDGIKWQELPN